jgi:hypothetical protein
VHARRLHDYEISIRHLRVSLPRIDVQHDGHRAERTGVTFATAVFFDLREQRVDDQSELRTLVGSRLEP